MRCSVIVYMTLLPFKWNFKFIYCLGMWAAYKNAFLIDSGWSLIKSMKIYSEAWTKKRRKIKILCLISKRFFQSYETDNYLLDFRSSLLVGHSKHSPSILIAWDPANYCRQQLVKQSQLSSKSNQYELPINRLSYACELKWPRIECIDTLAHSGPQSTCIEYGEQFLLKIILSTDERQHKTLSANDQQNVAIHKNILCFCAELIFCGIIALCRQSLELDKCAKLDVLPPEKMHNLPSICS